MRNLSGSLSQRGINRIRIETGSLEGIKTENLDAEKRVGNELVRETRSLLPEQTAGRGEREVETEQDREATTTFL
jgi:hypothetical protein